MLLKLQDRWTASKTAVIPALLLGGVALLGGCAAETTSPQAGNTGSSEQLQIVTTFAPLTSFTKAVAGDRAQVVQLLPSGVSPHDYESRPNDIISLQKANVVIENGLEFEPFLANMIEASENKDAKVIDSSEGISVAEMAEGAHEGHDEHDHEEHGHHDEHGHDDHAHEEDHDDHAHEGEHSKEEKKASKAHDGHAHGEHDPHIWLDPKRAVQQVENIRDGLIAVDPEGKEVYEANAQSYIEELNALDQEITQQLEPYKGKTFVTYHDFAHYFAESYGLNAEFLVGVPSENASPEDVTRVIDAVKESNLKTLLTEPQAVNDPFSALAGDLNISVSQFDPMGTSSSTDIQADSYITIMQSNLKNLSAAFAAQSTQSFWFQPGIASTQGIAMVPSSFFKSH